MRDRGRVVVVGDVGMEMSRRDYYEKEIDLRLSRSYGPGRYDPAYEEQGHDYPLGYVRWTENRNMEAFLDLLASGRGTARAAGVAPVSDRAGRAAPTRLLTGETKEPYIGILLAYDDTQAAADRRRRGEPKRRCRGGRREGTVRFGIIGAGQFAQGDPAAAPQGGPRCRV